MNSEFPAYAAWAMAGNHAVQETPLMRLERIRAENARLLAKLAANLKELTEIVPVVGSDDAE